MIVYNDFINLYQNLFSLIAMFIISSSLFGYLIVISKGQQNMIYILCYFITIISLTMCCYFKYYVYFSGKKKQIMTLNSIGYTFKNIYKIQKRELLLLVIMLIFLPIILFIFMFLKSNINTMKIFLLFIYVIALILLYVFNRFLINNKMKEIIENEQQFNRSE